jgi:hypothetical protein
MASEWRSMILLRATFTQPLDVRDVPLQEQNLDDLKGHACERLAAWRFWDVGTAHCVGNYPPAMLPTPALMQRARASPVEARALSRCEWRPATLTSSMNLEARVALRAHSCHGFTLSFLTHVS